MRRLRRFRTPEPLLPTSLPQLTHALHTQTPSFTDLISNNKWTQLKALIKPTNPTRFLTQLFESNAEASIIFTYFKWSQLEFQVQYTLPNLVKLLYLLSNDKKHHPKIQSLLNRLVKHDPTHSVSSFFEAIVSGNNNLYANSVIIDRLILAYVNNSKLDLALEGLRMGWDRGFKLTGLSCNALLSGLAEEGNVEEVENLYAEMIRKKIEFDLSTFYKVIIGLCEAGRLNKVGDVAKDMKVLVFDLIKNQHWSQLKTLIKPTNPFLFLQQLFDSEAGSDIVLAYFQWSEHGYQVRHTLQDYVKVLHLLAKDKKYPKVRSLLQKFVKGGETHSVSLIFHTILNSTEDFCASSIIIDMLILTYVNNSKLHLAVEAFKRAGDYEFKLSVLSCNPLLYGLVKEGRVGVVESVYKEMIRRRIQLNLITFNMVITGFCKAGKLIKAGDVVEDMKVRGVLPSVITYNILIDGYCKRGGSGKMYKADALLREMVEKRLCPNEITYNILIDGFCKDDNVAAAMKLFKEMKGQGLRPNVVTYNSLINGLCGDGKVDEALVLKDEMVGSDLQPNIVTYNALMNGFSKKEMLKEARELFDDIVKQGLDINVITFNTLIDAYCKAGKMGEAMALRDFMSARNVLPNVSTYNSLIGGYYQEGNMEAANKLLDEMENKGPRADLVTYNIRINALCKRGESRKAVRLLDEMSERGLIPSHITYNSLMAGYCQEGNPRAACHVRKRMEKEGKRPNVVTYNVLIKGFSEKGRLEEANAFLNEMLEKGLVPNRTTYDIIKEQMMEKGFVPDIDGHLYNDSINS